MEVALVRHHRKEKRFGPGPANGYTGGYAAKGGFFNRIFRRRKTATADDGHVLPEHTHPDQLDPYRQSHATDRTAVNNYPDNTYNKYENTAFSQQHDPKFGRQDQIHYLEAEYGVTHPAPRQAENPNYRYEDGVYDRA
jgi:hypothetical protein